MSQSFDSTLYPSPEGGCFASAIAATSTGVVMSNARLPDHPLTFVNAGFLRITGFTESEIIGRNCRLLQGPETSENARNALKLALRERRGIKLRLLNYRKAGAPFWNELTIDPIFDDKRRLTGFVGIQKDVTAEVEAQSQLTEQVQLLDATNQSLIELQRDLEQQAYFDVLTGLTGRSLFYNHLDQALMRCRRNDHSLAVMLMDLDGFKQVNDCYGHDAGDRVLRQVAARLREQLREADNLARLGGDEFILFIEPGESGVKSAAGAAELTRQRLSRAFLRPFTIDERDVHLGISMGVALYPSDGLDSDSLVHKADLAMYRDKQTFKLAQNADD